MQIAQLSTADWAVFRQLRLAALADAPYAFGSSLADEHSRSEADWRERLSSRVQFVAREAGEPLGTAGALRDGDAIELVSMWVAPAARGRGVGAALVAHIATHARAAGCTGVILWVSDGNAAAERLYARCGFVRTGNVQPIRPGEPAMEVQMRRELGE